MTNPTSIKMTPTRVAVIQAIADPNIEVYASLGGIFNTSWVDADVWQKNPDGTRRKVTKTVADLEKAGLVERAPIRAADPNAPWAARNATYRAPRHYTLTSDGVAVVAGLNKTVS